MKTALLCSLLAVALVSCGERAPEPNGTSSTPEPTGQRAISAPAKAQQPERAVSMHVLIAFADTPLGTIQKRSREQAAQLALEVLERARRGEDFATLVREYSDDPDKATNHGRRALRNFGVAPEPGREEEARRHDSAFGDVLFSLDRGEVGLVEYDPKRSPLGFFVVQRVE